MLVDSASQLQSLLDGLVLILVVQAIACAFLAGWLAGEKGRNSPSWFVLGLLFGFLALFAVGLAPSQKRDVGPAEPSALKYWFWRLTHSD